MPTYPLTRLLVPPTAPGLPDTFLNVQAQILNGFPHFIDLTKSVRLKITMPTGLLRQWMDADPSALVATSDDTLAPRPASLSEEIGGVTRPALRIALLQNGAFLSTVPVAAGVQRTLPDDGSATQGVAIDVALVSWNIFAGTVRGPGDFGSSIQLAWRFANAAVNDFGPPVINIFLWHRLIPRLRLQSELGLREFRLADRFLVRRMALRVPA
jgi:hypothetical protein